MIKTRPGGAQAHEGRCIDVFQLSMGEPTRMRESVSRIHVTYESGASSSGT